MLRCTAFAIALAASCIASNAFADHHETATAEEFQEFVKLMQGRWSGDVTLIADWPGNKKKQGDKIISYHSRSVTADANGLLIRIVGGEPTATRLMAYDPGSKKIKVMNVDSSGGFFQGVIWKESDNKWAWRVTGGLVDGRKTAGKGYWVFSDGGNTQTLAGDVTIDGAPTAPLKDIFHRLGE